MTTFTGSNDQELSHRLDLPAGEPRACAIFAHCFTCSKDSKAAAYISKALAARGIAVLRFDFASLEFTSNIADLVAAAAQLAARYPLPQILVGHSLGGAAVLGAAGEIAPARAVATIGAPFEPKHVLHVAGRLSIAREALGDLEQCDPAATLGALRKPLLVMHAPGDRIVGIDNAAKIFKAAKHPKSFVSLDGADHLLTKPDDAAYAAEVVATWSSRYLQLR